MQDLQGTYHPPQAPQLPTSALNSLIPRLTTTINAIDTYKTLLASGNLDGSLPTRDALLQRYSLLLGRITALSEYIQRPSTQSLPLTLANPNISSSSRSNEPALSKYIIHPLNPLPANVNPLAGDTLFQALNTLPLPGLEYSEEKDRLRKMVEEGMIEKRMIELKGRLRREGERARNVLDEVERVGGEMDWELRIGDEGEGEEEEQVKIGKEEKEEEEDLFGDEEDDIIMVDPPPLPQKRPDVNDKLPNPREGWTINDYVQYIDLGRQPSQTA